VPEVNAASYLAIAGAGLAAGTVNTIVGSGSLLTFPTLVGVGYSPFVANVSNTVGLVPGSVAGAMGYAPELSGQRQRAASLGGAAIVGGLGGGTLLLLHPSTFKTVVPWLILLAVAMVIVQPRMARALAGRGNRHVGGWALRLGVALTGIYGGYFGAAQGVLLLGILGLGLDDDLQRLNGLKNVLAGLVNGVAAVLFMIAAPVAWVPAVVLAASSTCGGVVGARIGRRIPAALLRFLVVVAGTSVAVALLV
jgi:uncharacterized protein